MTTSGDTTTDLRCGSARPARAGDAVRVRRSIGALADALLELVSEGRGLDVTVSALCERAGVSRPTFYQHFTSVEDLLSQAVRMRLDDLDADGGTFADVLRGLATDHATYGANLGDTRVMSRVYATVCAWMVERIRADRPDLDRDDVEFAAGGATRLLVLWLREDAADAEHLAPEAMARRLHRLVVRAVGVEACELSLSTPGPAARD